MKPPPFEYSAPTSVSDALAPLGVRVTELPMTPDRLRAAIRAAEAAGRR